jgi:hypothetical protein
MFALKGKQLLKKFNNVRIVLGFNKNAIRFFSSSHGHDVHGHNGNGHNGHGHNVHESEHGHDGHDDGHGHHHHEITGEVDLNKVYVNIESQNKKYISLTGILNSNKNFIRIYEGEAKARNAITPIAIPLFTRSRHNYRDLANVSLEENTYFHPEPYGYLVSDDVRFFKFLMKFSLLIQTPLHGSLFF